MSEPESKDPGQKARLGLVDAVSILIGIIIGSTIYETPPLIFRNATDPLLTLILWGAGGLLAFVGALCYAELATTYPRDGGDYNYLTRAYGPLVGYLFGWAQLAVVQTGSIGLMAYIFATYMTHFAQVTGNWGLAPFEVSGVTVEPTVVYASAAIVVLTLVNLVGVVLGKIAQNLLTLVKIAGLLAIIVAGFAFAPASRQLTTRGEVVSATAEQVVVSEGADRRTFKVAPPAKGQAAGVKTGQTVVVVADADAPDTAVGVRAAPAPSYGGISFALILILLAYGGYNDAAFVAAEVRNRRRNLPLALFIGTLAVMAIYLLVNGAYLRALGYEGAVASEAIAAQTLKLLPGEAGAHGEWLISVLVMVSALGAVNGLIFTSSRVYATMGADYSLLGPLARRTRGGTPPWAMLLQLLVCLAMVWGVGTSVGREALNQFFHWLGIAQVKEGDWGRGGFEPLVKMTAPIFWLFFLLTGMALFVLRINDRDVERPFAAPLFPVTPLLFCAMCAYMLHSGINYAGQLGLVGGGLVLLGIPLYVLSRRRNVAAGPATPALTQTEA